MYIDIYLLSSALYKGYMSFFGTTQHRSTYGNILKFKLKNKLQNTEIITESSHVMFICLIFLSLGDNPKSLRAWISSLYRPVCRNASLLDHFPCVSVSKVSKYCGDSSNGYL